MGQMQADATSMRWCAHLFAVRFAAAHRRSMPVHTSLMLSFNSLRLCFPFQVVADKPFLAKYTKGVKLLAAWDELAATISTVPDFAHAEGVTGRGCRVKYKEMMAAHRQEVKNGEFTSGVREGMDDATHEALNTCMQQEDEAEENAAKSKGEIAAIEEAKQDRAEKVGLFLLRNVTCLRYYCSLAPVCWS